MKTIRLFPFPRPVFNTFGLFGGGGDDDDSGSRKTIITVIAIIAILGSIVSLAITMRHPRPPMHREPFIGLGQAMADETIKAIGDHGRIVLVITPYHLDKNSPTHDQYTAFQNVLKKHRAIDTVATVQIPMDVMRPDVGIPRAKFDELLKTYGQVNAIVSFVDLPALDEGPVTLPDPAPKIIAMNSMPSLAKAYLANGIATVVITSRIVPEANPAATPKTPQEWFNKFFQIVTPQNYQELPD